MRRVLKGREEGSSQQVDHSPQYTPTPPAKPGAAVRLWGRSFPGAFSRVSQHRWATGRAGGSLGMSKSGMVTEWLLSHDQRKSWG